MQYDYSHTKPSTVLWAGHVARLPDQKRCCWPQTRYVHESEEHNKHDEWTNYVKSCLPRTGHANCKPSIATHYLSTCDKGDKVQISVSIYKFVLVVLYIEKYTFKNTQCGHLTSPLLYTVKVAIREHHFPASQPANQPKDVPRAARKVAHSAVEEKIFQPILINFLFFFNHLTSVPDRRHPVATGAGWWEEQHRISSNYANSAHSIRHSGSGSMLWGVLTGCLQRVQLVGRGVLFDHAPVSLDDRGIIITATCLWNIN